MVGRLLKIASKIAKSKGIKPSKPIKGISSTKPSKKQLEDFYKRWQKENKIPPGTPGPKTKKKQMEKFVEIRKKTKPAWNKKKKFD